MTDSPIKPCDYVANICGSGTTIYDPIKIGDPLLWIPTPELQTLLNNALQDLLLSGLPIRTRSKIIKEHICSALGYPVPKSFRKTKPRFPGQCFDTYAQKSNNLQIWNEELSASRRYVLIGISIDDRVTCVKVVTGDSLALLDTTGTLTRKYQARCIASLEAKELITKVDTSVVLQFVFNRADLSRIESPISQPRAGEVLPIAILYERLGALIGMTFQSSGSDQERNRGASLHRLACAALGYSSYQDNGQFPDIRHQLLEVKLQTASTIDLGIVRPDSIEPLDVPMIKGHQIRHCDVRYAIFYGRIDANIVTLTHLFLTTGQAFFTRFPQCQGNILNAKLQIPLPSDFFRS